MHCIWNASENRIESTTSFQYIIPEQMAMGKHFALSNDTTIAQTHTHFANRIPPKI